MSDGFEPPQGGFRAPRIPFDLRCVVLAAAGFLVMVLADWLLGELFRIDSPMWTVLVGTFSHFTAGGWPGGLEWWQFLVTVIVFFAIWALFGGALLRASGLRLTRDEPLSLKESLKFGGSNWHSYMAAPLIVVAFAAFFTLCNVLAGLVLNIQFVGSTLLNIVLFPLVLISSLLVTFSLLGGIVTLPLMWSGIAIEQNGALEAVSRAFSYLFARPLRFFFGYALILLLAGIVLLIAGHFESTVKHSLKAGVFRSNLDDLLSRQEDVGRVESGWENSPTRTRWEQGISNIHNIKEAEWYDVVGFLWMWLLLGIFMLGFKGYAIYILLGGTVSLYLQLRREVDGADESEIYPPLEEEGVAPEGTEPRWVGEKPETGGEPPAEEAEAPAEEAEEDEEEEGEKEPESED